MMLGSYIGQISTSVELSLVDTANTIANVVTVISTANTIVHLTGFTETSLLIAFVVTLHCLKATESLAT